MLDVMTSVTTIVLFIVITWWTLYALSSVHDSKDDGNGKYGWTTYKKFQEVFNKSKKDLKIGNGYFTNRGLYKSTWIDVIEIKFDGTHMILYPISYFRFVIWFKKYTKNKTKLEKIKW